MCEIRYDISKHLFNIYVYETHKAGLVDSSRWNTGRGISLGVETTTIFSVLIWSLYIPTQMYTYTFIKVKQLGSALQLSHWTMCANSVCVCIECFSAHLRSIQLSFMSTLCHFRTKAIQTSRRVYLCICVTPIAIYSQSYYIKAWWLLVGRLISCASLKCNMDGAKLPNTPFYRLCL